MSNKKKVRVVPLLLCSLVLFMTAAGAHDGKHNPPNKATTAVENVASGAGESIFRLVAEAVYKNDPAWQVASQRSRQWAEQAKVDGELPNPVFTTGLFNVPFDGLSLTENPTTQWRFGIKQAIPRGKTRSLKTDKARWQSESLQWQARAMFLQRARQTQLLWLDLFFLSKQRAIVKDNHRLLGELAQLAENKLAEGRGNQQDVIQARVEMLRLEDELIQIRDKMHRLEAEYHAIAGHGDPQWPQLPANAETVVVDREDIRSHPQVRQYDALLAAAETGVSLAREQNKPMWVLGGEYRKRFGNDPSGEDRSDMFALTASIDLPFARKTARNAEVSAALASKNAWEDAREKIWLALSAEASSARSSLKLARQSSKLYRSRLLKEASLNVQAAEDAYAAGTGDFSAVISAQRNLLKTQLQAVKHQVNQWRAWVDLQALKGRWLDLFEQANNTTTDAPTSALEKE